MGRFSLLFGGGFAAILVSLGACNEKGPRNDLSTGGGLEGGSGGAPPDYVAEACDRICQASHDLMCGSPDCAAFSCNLRDFETYSTWCRDAIDAAARCIAEVPDEQFECTNEVARVDEDHFERPCEDALAAMRNCLYEGPTGGIDASVLAEPCAQRCAMFTALPCYMGSECEAECNDAMANSSPCNAIKASVLLCQLENGAMAECQTDSFGTVEAVMHTPPACDSVSEAAFDCEFSQGGF